MRTELGSVYVQPDVCNGCGYCVVGCPFGVIDRRDEDGRAWKCTLCYDRLKDGLEPACAKACPTESIQFGDLDDLRARAAERVEALHERGVSEAYLYGADGREPAGHRGPARLLPARATGPRSTTCRPIPTCRPSAPARRGGRWPRRGGMMALAALASVLTGGRG